MQVSKAISTMIRFVASGALIGGVILLILHHSSVSDAAPGIALAAIGALLWGVEIGMASGGKEV